MDPTLRLFSIHSALPGCFLLVELRFLKKITRSVDLSNIGIKVFLSDQGLVVVGNLLPDKISITLPDRSWPTFGTVDDVILAFPV